MGADVDQIHYDLREELHKSLHRKYCQKDEFLIVSGGKIERNKKTHLLMQAVADFQDVKLIVFGTVANDYKNDIEHSINDNVIMAGWKSPDEISDIFLGADLAVFPGQHSVLWEQACACKLPCLFAKWSGMQYLNNGGNSAFIEDISVLGIKRQIIKYKRTKEYYEMDRIAKSEATGIYSYKNIADKSLECYKDVMEKENR